MKINRSRLFNKANILTFADARRTSISLFALLLVSNNVFATNVDLVLQRIDVNQSTQSNSSHYKAAFTMSSKRNKHVNLGQ